jgi:penicillin-binding protein 2
MKPVGIGTPQQWDVIWDGMEGAVTNGTASAFLVKPYRYKFAGKTGTAQVFTVKQTESTKTKATDERKRDHAWFIAFAPVDDPKIAIAVLVENGGFGGATSAPIAQKVLDAYLLGDQAGLPPATTPAHPQGTAAHPATARPQPGDSVRRNDG